MKSPFLFMGALCAFLGVGFGAFGAHSLKASLTPDALIIYQTGVNYQMWHALGLFGIGLHQNQVPGAKLLSWAGWLMFLGVLVFSGSLYFLAITGLRWIGMVTPIGGVCFLIAWLLVCISVNKNKLKARYK